MKKTILLTTIAAASALTATATTIKDGVSLNLGTTSYTIGDAMWTDTDFTVTMTLDIVKLKADLKNSGISKKNYNLCLFSLRSDSNNAAYKMGTMVIYTSSSTAVTTSSLWTTANGSTGRGHITDDGYLSTYVDSQWDHADGASLTMTHSTAGSYALLTIHLSDGRFLEYENEDSGLHWSGERGVSSVTIGTSDNATNPVMQAYLFNSKVSIADVKAINKQLLPEPTTATLSLLALVGLVARRRRRK